MNELLIASILNFATKFGIEATKVFLAKRGSTIDDAIAALDAAQKKSIEEYIAEDAQQRAMQSQTLDPPGAPA